MSSLDGGDAPGIMTKFYPVNDRKLGRGPRDPPLRILAEYVIASPASSEALTPTPVVCE